MTESDIVYLASEYLNRTWDVMQFWASVSFGLMAVSHLGGRHLNGFLAAIASILYIAFTLFVMNILRINGAIVDGFLQDLQALGTLSRGARAIVDTALSPLEMGAIMLAYFGLFAGALTYLWYGVIRARRQVAQTAMES